MANMTRAEAICAATNIIDLAEELDSALDGKFPKNYHDSVHNQCTSMRERIKANARYPTITENMDAYFRKTWTGLRKWDHDDAFNDELFFGLSDVILELQQDEEAEADKRGEAVEPSKKKQKGRETTDTALQSELNGLVSDETQQRAKAAQEAAAAPVTKAAPAPPRESTGDLNTGPTTAQTVARFKENVSRLREERISVVLSQVIAKNIRLVDKSVIHHCDIEHILKKTSSDRTQQLIMAAFLAGKIAGIFDLASELKDNV